MKVYTQGKQEADVILHKVLDAFEKHQVTPNPMNFLVWYEYFLGRNPQLHAMLKSELNNRAGYTDSLGVRVYETFLKEQNADTSDLENAFRKLLEMMISKLMDWSKGMENHTQALGSFVDQLSGDQVDPETLRTVTGQVLSTTKSIVASQQQLQTQLMGASKEIHRLQEELENARAEAMTDMLTKLANRRWFEQDMESAMTSCKQSNELGVILIDIDHFKQFNDTYGHLVGDAVLRFIASILKKNTEPSHLVARLGGEEFAVMVPRASQDQIMALSERLREKVATSHLKRKDTGETIGNITISAGVSMYRPGEDWDSLYLRADKALYKSKENGRNRTTLG